MMSSFSETLRRIRFERHMTQDEFAALLGTTKQNISRYESGAVSPKISTAQAIADKLGISLAELNGQDASAQVSQDDELWTLREEMRRDPERRRLFKLAAHATLDDVKAADALLNALKATNPDFYDGDDPA